MAQLREGGEERGAREARATAGERPAAAGRQRCLTGTVLHLLGERPVRGPFRVPQPRRRVHRRDQAKAFLNQCAVLGGTGSLPDTQIITGPYQQRITRMRDCLERIFQSGVSVVLIE